MSVNTGSKVLESTLEHVDSIRGGYDFGLPINEDDEALKKSIPNGRSIKQSHRGSVYEPLT
jgi:hypothetical protein